MTNSAGSKQVTFTGKRGNVLRDNFGTDRVLGHFGGGLEYRFTPHIGLFGKAGYDIPLTEVAAERMRQLATARSRYQKPVASPTLAYFGLDPAAERERFADYCARFEIPSQ